MKMLSHREATSDAMSSVPFTVAECEHGVHRVRGTELNAASV